MKYLIKNYYNKMRNLKLALLFLNYLGYSQNDNDKKFQIGTSYFLKSDEALFNNPFSLDFNYQVKHGIM